MRNFKEVSFAPFWVAEKKGDSVEGVVVRTDGTITTVNGDMDFITLKTEEGEKAVAVSAGLRNLIEQIELGYYIKIVYKGEETNKKSGRKFKAYSLFVDSPNLFQDSPFIDTITTD